jgi:hypothetical protein
MRRAGLMKIRRLTLILLIIGGVLFMAEVRLYDTGRMSKKSPGTPTLWSTPPPEAERPLKFVDPPMPRLLPPPPTWERDNRRR